MNLSDIQVSFADDVSSQLTAVLRDQHGMLALLNRDSRAVTRYLFTPPGWEMRDVVTDIGSQLRILMDPPERWAVWRRIASRDGIDLERYQAVAVFKIAYRRCLMEAIKAHAGGLQGGRRVSAVRLAFAADQPCGIKVLEVSFANHAVSRPS